MKYQTKIDDLTLEIEITKGGKVLVDGEPRDVDFLPLDDSLFSLIAEHASYEVVIDSLQDYNYEVLIAGKLHTVNVMDERALLLGKRSGADFGDSGEVSIKSPMPGLVVSVTVSEGQEIRKGDTVVILESMKMQNELKTPRDGTVQRIGVEAGQSVEQNKVLVTIT